ncbi:hypothetical protein CLI64_27740 [Nostoc sp. CENA543]|uniref:DUF1822 family protein n=1 Tax=Nostoc sp. CENA543 TaxID=1869241 RepID=UPI000CA3C31F|nr:DUF1822 family protein [Nostoc sp. CENA543]AUT03879.1 hypothetical protein CLI64_27740 [Nostoc sp. CENA543]
MINTQKNPNKLRLIMPELILLEPEHFETAKNITYQVFDELQQWQIYLNALASLGFIQWLQEYFPEQQISQTQPSNDNCNYIQLDKFKLCLIATENLLDELVNIPEYTINEAETTAHLYVVIEVLEEQAELIIRGILRYDQITAYINISGIHSSNNYYQIPLSVFDIEPNHIIFYCRFLDVDAIPLPELKLFHPKNNLSQSLQTNKTKLSQWLQGIFLDEWQSITALVNSEMSLALNIRNSSEGVKRGKIINLGISLGNYHVVLLISIQEESEEKIRVLIQLHPSGEAKFLRPNLKLTLLSKLGKSLCEVTSRSQDNYIQVNPFHGEKGKQFSVEVSLDNIKIKEDFEI